VFYLANSYSGHIVFHKEAYNQISPALVSEGKFTQNNFQIKPEPGMLVIFPSGLPHSTLINSSSEDRYSIAFNLMPKGHVGHWEQSAWFSFN
jgi:ectoine hydroxylase-related dioxygenase (phytanoyl-CoA dioxygenase family)